MSVAATLVTDVSAVVGIVSLLAYLYSLRGTVRSAAREEALALAEARKETIAELEHRLTTLELHHRATVEAYDRRIAELEEALRRALRARL
jgi:hypothetical protein